MSCLPVRVALLTYSTRPRGGVVHTLALAEALQELGAQVEVWSLGRGGDTAFFREVSVPTHVVAQPDVADETVGERVLRSIRLLGAALDLASCDVVHAQDCISANAAGGRCLRTVHHLDTFTTPELAACHERAILQPAALACVSAAVAAEVRAQHGRSAVVIPNGVDAARFAGARPDPVWTDRFGRFVLSVGGIEPRKGTLDLVEAMALLPGRPALVVAGGETLFDYRDYRTRVLARASELDVRLEVLGPVAQDVLPGLVAAAGVFAFPSTKEGFGLAAMEALAAGVPVVCRDLPVLREVFDGSVRFFRTVPELAAALQADPLDPTSGRALAGRHTWGAAARAHLDWYAQHL